MSPITVSPAAFATLSAELEEQSTAVEEAMGPMQAGDPGVVEEKVRLARLRLLTAERAALQRRAIEGLISQDAAEHLVHERSVAVDQLRRAVLWHTTRPPGSPARMAREYLRMSCDCATSESNHHLARPAQIVGLRTWMLPRYEEAALLE